MNIFKPTNINKPDLLILTSAIVIILIFLVFQFVMFSEASTPNPGHSAEEIGSGAFGEVCFQGSDCLSGYCYLDADGDRYAPSSGTKKCQASSQLSGTDCCAFTTSDVVNFERRKS